MKKKAGLMLGLVILAAGVGVWRYMMVSAQNQTLAKFFDLQKNARNVQGTITIEDVVGQEVRNAQFLAESAKKYSVSLRGSSTAYEIYSDGVTRWIANTNNGRYYKAAAARQIQSTYDAPAFEPLNAFSPMLFQIPWVRGFSWTGTPVLEYSSSGVPATAGDSETAEGAYTLSLEIAPDGTPMRVRQIDSNKRLRRQATFEQVQFNAAVGEMAFRYRPAKSAVAVMDEGDLTPFLPSKPIARSGRQ